MRNIYCWRIPHLRTFLHLQVIQFKRLLHPNIGPDIMFRMDIGLQNKIFMKAGLIKTDKEDYSVPKNAGWNWKRIKDHQQNIKN